MAKRNTLTKAQRDITFVTAAGASPVVSYIDSAQSLSMVNRKLFSQQKCYAVADVQFYFQPSIVVEGVITNYDTLFVELSTMGDTWSVHNSWTKAKALHTEMQALVLDDNPSVAGTWADFKIFLDAAHRTNTIPVGSPGNLLPHTSVAAYTEGEWEYTQFVLPQHEVDPATSEPLPARS